MAKFGFADSSLDTYRGLLIPDERIPGALWEDESSFTEAGIQPGLPTPIRATQMTLVASGTPEEGAPDLDVMTVRNGFPARDLGMRVAIRNADQTPEEEWRGHWANHIPVSRERLADSTVGDGGFLRGDSPDIATMPDGGAIACWVDQVDATTVQVRASYRDSVTGAWSNDGLGFYGGYDVVTFTSTDPPKCSLATLPDGRILIFVAVIDSSSIRVDTYTSTDNGVTWEFSAPSAVPALDSTRYTLDKMTSAYGGPGEILLLMSVTDTSLGATVESVLLQFASADLGASFALVYAEDGAGGGKEFVRKSGGHDVAADRAGFIVTYGDYDAGPGVVGILYARRLASAYTRFGAVERIEIRAEADGGIIADDAASWPTVDIAVATDRNGTIWCYWREPDVLDSTDHVSMSNDGGDTWQEAGDGDIFISPSGFKKLAACADRGRVLLVHRYASVSAVYEQSLYVQVCGGWMAVPAPVYWGHPTPGSLASQAGPNNFYAPILVPDSGGLGWTLEDNAGPANAHSANGVELNFRANVGDYVRWKRAYGNESIVNSMLDLTPYGGSAGMELLVSDDLSTGSLRAWVYVRPDEIELYDQASASVIKVTGLGTNIRVQVAMGVSAGVDASAVDPKIAVWYRVTSEDTLVDGTIYDAPWVLLYAGTLADNGAATTAVIFGALGNTGDGAAQNHAGVFQHQTWVDLAAGFNPTDFDGVFQWSNGRPDPTTLEGRAMTVIPEHALDGVFISAKGGPAFQGDSWLHTPLHDFAAEHLAPRYARSPSQGWLATDETTDAQFAWDLTGFAGDTYTITPVLGLHIKNTSHPLWKIEAYTTGVGWTTLADIDTRDAFGTIVYNFHGNVALISSGADPADSPGGYYLMDQELNGGTFYADDGSTYPITRSTGGLMVDTGSDAENTRLPRLVCDTTAVPSSTSGTAGKIAPSAFTVAVRVDGVAYSARALRVTAVADTVSTNPPMPKAGVAVLGPVHIFGLDYDESVTTTRRAAVTSDQDASGQIYTRKRGDTRRMIGVQWRDEGVWTAQLFNEKADEFALFSPDAGAWAVASLHELPLLVDGIFDHVDGSHIPLVLLQEIPKLNALETYVLIARNNAGGAIYGHINGEIQLAADYAGYGDKQRISVSFNVEEEA